MRITNSRNERLSKHPLPRLLFRQKENANEVVPFNLPAADRDDAVTRRRLERELKGKLDIELSESVLDKLPAGLTYMRARIKVGHKLDVAGDTAGTGGLTGGDHDRHDAAVEFSFHGFDDGDSSSGLVHDDDAGSLLTEFFGHVLEAGYDF